MASNHSVLTSTKMDQLKEQIISSINHPRELEKIYRNDKLAFNRAFNAIYTVVKDNSNAQIWHERLNYQQEEIAWGKKNEFLFVVTVALIAGLIAKIPDFANMNIELFYQKNIGFVVFPMLIFYFSWKQQLAVKKLVVPVVIILLSVYFINFFTKNEQSDATILTYIHLPIFLWSILGYIYIGADLKNSGNRINYLRFNGDFIVFTGIIFLSGVLFSAITINLFKIIGLNIEDFYSHYIAIFGAASIPIISAYLIQNNPQLVNKISPVIARIFTPVVFLTLLIFIIAVIFSGQNIFSDRNFLLMFNALLIGVMAIILFSLSEETKKYKYTLNLLFLFGLSILTIIANLIALSAIAHRLVEFGISPNRLAVLGANLLIFSNLIGVSYKLFLGIKGKADVLNVENTIGLFIPIYGIWAAIVTFLFPIIFK